MQESISGKSALFRPFSSHWGLMFHYLDRPASSNEFPTTSSRAWNQRIDAFDVSLFASQVKETGAGYIIFTLGQNTGHFCAPNPVYDELTGLSQSRLARRDLISEIAAALSPEVKLIAYLPSHAPAHHIEVARALRFMPPWSAEACGIKRFWAENECADERLSEFQRHWEDIVRYWGLKWRDKVNGWWIDGCYFHEKMYAGDMEPNFKTFAQALRAGNSSRILAFNAGTDKPFSRLTKEQDYTAGEVSTAFPVSNKWNTLESVASGQQLHLLSYLGSWWGEGEPRFDDQFVMGYTRQLLRSGGMLTWDVPIELNGRISDAFRSQLSSLNAVAYA